MSIGASRLAAELVAALDDEALNRLAEQLAPRLTALMGTDTNDGDRWLDSREAAAYLGLTRNALHKLTAARVIPFEQDGPGCKLWFRRSCLDRWRESGDLGPQCRGAI